MKYVILILLCMMPVASHAGLEECITDVEKLRECTQFLREIGEAVLQWFLEIVAEIFELEPPKKEEA